jgi:hypothetical protein
MTIYAVDAAKNELYSKFLALDTVKEIRLPVSEKSIAGYVAASARIVNIADAYDKAELARISPTLSFDGSWDKKTGFKTQQILGMPILHEGKAIGVIQLLNKKRGARFTKEDETGVLAHRQDARHRLQQPGPDQPEPGAGPESGQTQDQVRLSPGPAVGSRKRSSPRPSPRRAAARPTSSPSCSSSTRCRGSTWGCR